MKQLIRTSLIAMFVFAGTAKADVFKCEALKNFKGQPISSPKQYSVDVKSGNNGDVSASLIVNDGPTSSTHDLTYIANNGDDNVLDGEGMRVHIAFEYRGTKTWTSVEVELAGTDYFAECTAYAENAAP